MKEMQKYPPESIEDVFAGIVQRIGTTLSAQPESRSGEAGARPSAEVAAWLHPSGWGGRGDALLTRGLEKLRAGRGAELTAEERDRLRAWIPRLTAELHRISKTNYERARRMTRELQRTIEPHLSASS